MGLLLILGAVTLYGLFEIGIFDGILGTEDDDEPVPSPPATEDTGDMLDDVSGDNNSVDDEPLAEALESYTSGPANGADGFNIEIVFEGDWSREQQVALIEAADYLSTVITDDIPDGTGDFTGIDDIQVVVEISEFFDQNGNIVEAGAADYAEDSERRLAVGNSETGLPYTGRIMFQEISAIANDPEWFDTAYHELVHALGFGDDTRLVTTNGVTRYTGENAISAYENTFPTLFANDPNGSEGVPIDEEGAHWLDSFNGRDFLPAEIMSEEGGLGYAPILSDLSLAYLEDIGYETVWTNPDEQEMAEVQNTDNVLPTTVGDDTCTGQTVCTER